MLGGQEKGEDRVPPYSETLERGKKVKDVRGYGGGGVQI